MWCWPWPTFRTMVVSLLMLAPLLVYAVPSHAGMTPHENVVAAMPDDAVAYPDHGEALCDDAGLFHDGACCNIGQCASMHGGLPADVIDVFAPRLDTSTNLPAPAMPKGISGGPALRPPCLMI